MRESVGRSSPARRRSLTAIALACVVGAVLLLAALGNGAPAKLAPQPERAAKASITTAPVRTFHRLMVERLHAEHLDFDWVACVPNGRRFAGVRVVRCNVDFGIDPHVEAYCSVLSGGQLLTSDDDRSIRCGPDLKGWTPKVITYG
jgi:hypothetical protein